MTEALIDAKAEIWKAGSDAKTEIKKAESRNPYRDKSGNWKCGNSFQLS